VNACIVMLTRLEGEESLRAANVVSVGSGALEREAAQRVSRQWADEANAGRPRERPLPATPEVLADAGIGLHIVTRPA